MNWSLTRGSLSRLTMNSSNSATISFTYSNNESSSPNESGEDSGRYSYRSNEPHAPLGNKPGLNRNQSIKTSRFGANASVLSLTPPHERWRHVNGVDITDDDIVLGRGIGKSHLGNIKFRGLVRKFKYEYLRAPKAAKPRVAEKVVREWRKNGGRFLATKNGGGGCADIRKRAWYDVGDKKAREKASMSLRERTPETVPMLEAIRREKGAEMAHEDEDQENNGSVRPPLRSTSTFFNSPSFLAHPSNVNHHLLPRNYYTRYDGGVQFTQGQAAHEEPRAPPPYAVARPPPQNIRGPASDYEAVQYPPPSSPYWRDYSGGRSSTTTRRDRDLSPRPAGREHFYERKARSVFEATFRSEVLAEVRKTVAEQNSKIEQQAKLIALLEEKLGKRDCEDKAKAANTNQQEKEDDTGITTGVVKVSTKTPEAPIKKVKEEDTTSDSHRVPSRHIFQNPGLLTPVQENLEGGASFEGTCGQWMLEWFPEATEVNNHSGLSFSNELPLRRPVITASASPCPPPVRPNYAHKATSPLAAAPSWPLTKSPAMEFLAQASSTKRSTSRAEEAVAPLLPILPRQKKQKTSMQDVDEPTTMMTSV
mmetsp:Transcript_13916/g.30407  ORF Transcript_13916/g.30407 Transcript_13916/m.30407 type:complete len:592 (-) Transcript_13916:140-1915(-)